MFPPAWYRPKAPYFGVQMVATGVQLGTGATSIADTATTSVMLPKPPCTSCQLIGLTLNAYVAAISASGTVLLQVFKRDNAGTPADRTLTATKSLEADVVTVADTSYPVAITSTSIQNVTFRTSDACRVDVVTTNSVGTQPTITLTAMWAIVQP